MADPEPDPPGETHDGKGCGDHDVPFEFGSPRGLLTTRQQARLTVMRGKVMDARAGEHGNAADGDIEWLTTTESGLFVPIPPAFIPTQDFPSEDIPSD